MKRYLAAAMLLLALSGCGSSGSSTQLYTTTEDFFAMDTYMSVDVSSEKSESAAEDMAVKIEQRVNQLDAALSRTQQAGDLYKLNHANGQPTEVSDDTYTALEKALEYAEMTNGAFDPTMAPLTDLWGIGTDNARVPAQSEIDEALTHVGYQNVKLLGNNQVQLLNGAQVDLGGIGKGYASQQIADIFRAYDVTSAVVSLGGNVYVCGSKPDGSAWNVGVQDPAASGYAAIVALTDCFAVTSGGYQRYFEAADGTVYQHILDPRTGRPADSDLLSVTVISGDGTAADAYSTALYVMGEQEAVSFWRAHGGFELILITADGRLLYTPGLSDAITAPEGCAYDFQPIAA